MKKDYLEALASPQWQKKRLEIMQRDNFTCQFCGCKDRTLHIHHKVYEKGKKPWEYDNKDLITLCDRCHESETNDSKELYQNFLYLRDSMRSFGFSDAIINTLLERLGCLFENCDEEEPVCKDEIIKIIDNVVFGVINYNDLKTLKKFGVTHEDYIERFMPIFIEDYNNYKG